MHILGLHSHSEFYGGGSSMDFHIPDSFNAVKNDQARVLFAVGSEKTYCEAVQGQLPFRCNFRGRSPPHQG